MKLIDEFHAEIMTIAFVWLGFVCCFLYSGIKSLEFPVDTTPVVHVEKNNCYDIKSLGNETRVQFTAFTLSEDETDASPCIGAGNHNLCEAQARGECIVATWRHPLHTRLLIPGFGECEVLDRTNIKYSERIDILFKEKREANEFGIKTLSYQVIKL